METFSGQLTLMTESNQARLEDQKLAVEAKPHSIQEDNTKQLDQMRATVIDGDDESEAESESPKEAGAAT